MPKSKYSQYTGEYKIRPYKGFLGVRRVNLVFTRYSQAALFLPPRFFCEHDDNIKIRISPEITPKPRPEKRNPNKITIFIFKIG